MLFRSHTNQPFVSIDRVHSPTSENVSDIIVSSTKLSDDCNKQLVNIIQTLPLQDASLQTVDYQAVANTCQMELQNSPF